MGRQFEQHVYGGLYIPSATGGVNLYDMITQEDTGQDLVDQSITDTATLYITLNHNVKNFTLKSISIGYVDTLGADELSNVYILEGYNAEDSIQAIKCRYASGQVTEGILTHAAVERPIKLDEAGKVYFITDWGTLINVDAAGEYFYIRVDGVTMEQL